MVLDLNEDSTIHDTSINQELLRTNYNMYEPEMDERRKQPTFEVSEIKVFEFQKPKKNKRKENKDNGESVSVAI